MMAPLCLACGGSGCGLCKLMERRAFAMTALLHNDTAANDDAAPAFRVPKLFEELSAEFLKLQDKLDFMQSENHRLHQLLGEVTKETWIT